MKPMAELQPVPLEADVTHQERRRFIRPHRQDQGQSQLTELPAVHDANQLDTIRHGKLVSRRSGSLPGIEPLIHGLALLSVALRWGRAPHCLSFPSPIRSPSECIEASLSLGIAPRETVKCSQYRSLPATVRARFDRAAGFVELVGTGVASGAVAMAFELPG